MTPAARATAIRIFLTCWIVFTLHFASNTVREIYLGLAIGDRLSFRVDEYGGMHPDLFEMPGRGWHINSNPGASMAAAIPYAMARPLIDPVVAAINRHRAQAGPKNAPDYDSPWPMAQKFYEEAWRRGYDIKFGLAALAMQTGCMATTSALGAVMIFLALRRLLDSERAALWLALLYAFGTPVFFRTGYLNHNMMLGHVAFFGFLCLWNPGGMFRWTLPSRSFLAGVTGGAAVLFDYSGSVLLLGLFAYALAVSWKDSGAGGAMRIGGWYVAGTLGPVFLLWFYQWQSFGNPFLPAQRWMPAVAWSDQGYQGFSPPQLELFLAHAWDYRYGLLTSCPMFVLAFAFPFLKRGRPRGLEWRETAFLFAFIFGLWIFASCVNYARLQFNTGIRYMAPAFPFLFLPLALTLARLPKMAIYFIGVAAVTQAWCMAMYRDVERGRGVLEPVLHVFTAGFQLPALTVASRLEGAFGDYFAGGASPLPLFAVAGAMLYGIWKWTLKSPPLT
ncbi:MAG: hypothetical protein KIT09_03130 [Bryobacteraceae bacterium]|nr:hypothetical protein [Bryobacteraceae bacterium]